MTKNGKNRQTNLTANNQLKFLFQNEDFAVIDKPSGLVVNKSQTTPIGTLQDILDNEFVYTESETEVNSDSEEFTNRAGIVHRLDKDTSGVLIIAKNHESFKKLQEKFKNREIEKEYIAVVFGKPRDPFVEIRAPILRDPKNRFKFAISNEGKSAISKVETLNSIEIADKVLSIMKIIPLTGRTHQIRVHLRSLGTPIVGDVIYSSKKQCQWAYDNGFPRMMLHAHKIKVDDAWYESPLPDIFEKLMKMAEK